MVKHGIRVRGVDLAGNEQKPPVIVQMNDDDFPTRFLCDLAAPGQPQVSSAAIVSASATGVAPTLFQPVQRMLNVAMADLCCETVGYPRVDPKRIVSAGLVIRRVIQNTAGNEGSIWSQSTLAAWMQDTNGRHQWLPLTPDQEELDPDPAQRKLVLTGQSALDQQLAALSLSTAYTESTTPAFAVPPATSAAICRSVVYGVVPTASSEVSDAQALVAPVIQPTDLLNTLPPLLCSSQVPKQAPPLPAPGAVVDYRWMADEFLNAIFPPSTSGTPPVPTPNASVAAFHGFTTALRMLDTVFGALDASASSGNTILNILNGHNVTFPAGMTAPPAPFGQYYSGSTMPMGVFYQWAKSVLIDQNMYPAPGSPAPGPAPTLTMPSAWDGLTDSDQNALLAAMVQALVPRSIAMLSPTGRFQDSSRSYQLRIFLRLKGETPNCPLELVWSRYSEAFSIAPWHASSDRPHPPIPLPNPTLDFMQKAKPNCSFQVPGPLMSAMQGTSLSGLMSGAGGGGGLQLGWICGFNIPLITICAFFVLNIFLSLLNIVFFWLPFIKICIPIPED